MSLNKKNTSFKYSPIVHTIQSSGSNVPNQNFIDKVNQILIKNKIPMSSSTLRMKLGDSLAKSDLPPNGKFNEWMGKISGIERNDTVQVDMPFYKISSIPLSVSPISTTLSTTILKQTNKSELDNKLQRTVNRVKAKYDDWVVEWNKFNTEDPSIDQWNKLNDSYTDLNKKIQTIKNFFNRHQDLIKDYHPNNMPKKPSDTLVYTIGSIKPIEPILSIEEPKPFEEIKIEEPKPILYFNSSLFPDSVLPFSHLPPPPPSSLPPPPPPPPSQPSYLSPNVSIQTTLQSCLYKPNQPTYPSYSPMNVFDNVNNQSNLFPKSPSVLSQQSQPQSFPPPPPPQPNQLNLLNDTILYDTLIKLRNYGLMEPGSLAEKALIIIQQMRK